MRATRRHAGSSGEAGLTLTELMITIAIIAILAATIGKGLARTDNRGAVDMFTRRVLIALRQARNTAVDSGSMVCVTVESTSVTLDRLGTAGYFLPTSGCDFGSSGPSKIRMEEITGSSGATILAVANSAHKENVSSPTGTVPAYFLFTPEGAAIDTLGTRSGYTIFLRDPSQVYYGKVLVFGITGYTYSMDQW